MKQARINFPLPLGPSAETVWNVSRRESLNAQRQLGRKGDPLLLDPEILQNQLTTKSLGALQETKSRT